MVRKRIQNILRKEWLVMLGDLNSALFVTLLPLLIVGQAVLIIWLIVHFGGEGIITNTFFTASLEKLRDALPSVSGLPDMEQFQVLLLSQFNMYLLLIPTMIAISFATFSIVEEKMSRSLEPLLATPVRTWELLLGKALSGALPALFITWVCAGILLTPSWFLSLCLLTPGVALLSFLLGIIGSSRAKDAKSAQNIVVFVVFPILALVGVQVIGLVWFTPLLTLVLALVIVVVDLLVLRVATNLFQRESIVVSWQ